jgi:chemotaxis protein CheX
MIDDLSHPFVGSVENVFSMMLKLEVRVGQPHVARSGPDPDLDVSGIIGMSGDVEGNVALRFPVETACRVASLFIGGEVEASTPDFADAIGELANMVVGGAKAKFSGRNISISCPSVIVGEGHMVIGARDNVCVAIPCECDCGQFVIEVLLKEASAQAFGLNSSMAA